MPMTLNIGHSRKVGEPNYSSRGASVNLEIEVEGNLVNDPQRLKESIRKLFALARASVEEELNGSHQGDQTAADRNVNGTPRATASQLRAIQTLARRHQIDLPGLLADRYGDSRPDELSLNQASALIDDLNGELQTAGGRR